MELYLIYFEDCPGWKQTKENLDAVLEDLSLDISYQMIEVTDDMEALPESFYGSPTVAYKTEDSMKDLLGLSGESVMACRTYNHDGRIVPYIPKETLRDKILEVMNNEKE